MFALGGGGGVRGGLGWAGLGWAGLGWAGLGWAGLGWAGLGWAGLGWAGLGLNTSPGSSPCTLCPEHPLDPLGHNALTCKRLDDVVLRDVVLQTCHRACISAKVEAGSGQGHEHQHTHPADILASCGKPAAFDLSVTSPLNSSNSPGSRSHSRVSSSCSCC